MCKATFFPHLIARAADSRSVVLDAQQCGGSSSFATPGKQAKKPRTSYLGLQRGRGKDVFHDRAIACPSPSSTDLGSGHLILRTRRSVVGMTINALHATQGGLSFQETCWAGKRAIRQKTVSAYRQNWRNIVLCANYVKTSTRRSSPFSNDPARRRDSLACVAEMPPARDGRKC